MAPKLSAFGDSITQNPKLFARIDAVYAARDSAGLTPEQKRLVWVYWTRFTQQGAKLSAADKATFAANNAKLSVLYAKFAQNELADEESYVLTLDSPAQLKGLTKAQVDAAAAEGVRRGQPGKWLIANTRSAMEPFLTYADDRASREKGFRMWTMRGDNGGATDNNAIVTQILALRAANAKLIGYPTFAHWVLSDRMAKTPETAMALELAAWKPAVAQVHKDVAVMQAVVDKEHGGFKIAPWDYRYYAEKVRKAKYDLDLNEVKPYLQLDHVREAMFFAAGKVYGFTFTPVTGLSVFHPDVTVYEVKGRDGRHVGLWYFDPYARAGKNSGAWMNAYREQSTYDGDVPTIVSNNANFIKGAPGTPTTISFDDARTMFHEFGHALHGLNSNVTYPTLSGTNTVRDFVEFPSQLNENWFTTPEVQAMLVNSAGQPLPAALVDKISASRHLQRRVRRRRGAGVGDRRPRAPPRRVDADRAEGVRDQGARRPRHAVRDRHAPPHPAVRPYLRGRRLFGGLLRLSVGRRARLRRLRRVHRGGRAVRSGRRQAPPRHDHQRRQHRRPGGRLPQLPRARSQGRCVAARQGLPGGGGARCRTGWPLTATP